MSAKRRVRRWLQGHRRDPFVREASARGYRSRAAFKLLQLDRGERLLHSGQVVLDLGAAPGGWSQVAAERVGASGRVLALDLLPMTPLPGVDIMQGDFSDPAVRSAVETWLGERPADLVISDMAPNLTGVKAADAAHTEALCLAVLTAGGGWLRAGGWLVLKVFQGAGLDAVEAHARRYFQEVRLRKPRASRSSSAELYLLARGRGGTI